ncbi:MAG: methionyl-tRNA formyltransferase [Candidatus Niyogibacteria bacterium]|nr:methionyl-tRNA formyltransferase [Candidatus Niyogibacteria bacterium]
MKFVFLGTPLFAVRVLEELAKKNLLPSLVVTAPDKPAGRGLKLTLPPVKAWAESRRIPIFQPATLKSPEAAKRLAEEGADVFVVAAYGKLIPGAVLTLAPKGALNIHPSLLPRWRGADPIRNAILADDAETGVTIMQLDEKLDHGPLIAQKAVPVNEKTYEKLEEELAVLGGALLTDILPQWFAGAIKPREQNHTEATFTKKIVKEDGHLDWNESAETIERKIRALNPWPGIFTFWNEKRLRILKARSAKVEPWQDGQGSTLAIKSVGTVSRADSGLSVTCRNGSILIETLQLEGKKAMPSAEFARGYPDIIGTILA